MSHCCKGPGYASPQEAIKGPREKLMFVAAPHAHDGHDSLVVIDVDPQSEAYQKVVSKVDFPNINDEVHHFGWNACSSCHDKPGVKRTHLILPCLNSDRIYVVNVEDEKNAFLEKTIEPETIHALDLSLLHTTHCLPNGQIMISSLGDKEGNAKGDFLILDSITFEPIGTLCKKTMPFNYDFWYQPKRDVMISTEWGTPNIIKGGFNMADIKRGHYGHSVTVHKWSTHEIMQYIELSESTGALPFEVRFHHRPDSPHAYFCSVVGSSLFHIYPISENSHEYQAEEIVTIPAKKVRYWIQSEIPALCTDIVISMDDKYLYMSNWLHGDVRQFDISDPYKPKMTGQVFIGGNFHKESGYTLVEGNELKEQPEPLYLKGKRIEGGPQMLQVSLDGKRLYVTTSLYKKWDKQFYPDLVKNGGAMLLLNVDVENGGMTLDKDFFIDFGAIEGGPYLAHEMRYPGGDCTSEIWFE